MQYTKYPPSLTCALLFALTACAGDAPNGSVPDAEGELPTLDGATPEADASSEDAAGPAEGGHPPPADSGADASEPSDGRADAGPTDPRSDKRGVAYNFCDFGGSEGLDDLALLASGTQPGGGIRWYYNWGTGPSACVADALGTGPGAVEFVPMAWGLTDGGAQCESGGPCFNDGLSRADLIARIPEHSRYLLGFNEPNFAHQSNLTPSVAARAWQHLEQVAEARGLELVAPATNFCDPNPAADHAGSCTVEASERTVDFGSYSETFPAGHRYNAFAWAELFYDECSAAGAAGHDCRIAHQAGHVYSWWGLGWYVEIFERKAGLRASPEAHCSNGIEDEDEFGVDCGGNECVACTEWARAQFAKSLWLTEFAPSLDDAPAADEAARIARASEYIDSELPLLEQNPFVFRYAWFMPRTDIPSLDHVDLLQGAAPVQRTAAGVAYVDHPH